MEVSIGDYGNVYVPFPGTNCIESISYPASKPYWSGYSIFYSSGYGLDTIPKAANGFQYCYLISNNFNDPSLLQGYKASYYRPNNNICYDSHYMCNSEGVFSFFPGEGCTGVNESFTLPLELTQYSSANLGNISIQLFTVSKATLFFSWITVIPEEDIVPTFDNVGDWFALLFAIITLIIGIYMCYYTYRSVKRARKILFTQISIIIAQVLYMIFYIGSIVFWALVANNQSVIGAISQTNSVAFGVATFLMSLVTSYLVSEILFHEYRFTVRIINIILLIGIHIGFYGSSYGGIYIANVGPPTYSMATVRFVLSWYKYLVYWTFFVFTFNSTVPILVAVKLISLQTQKKAHKEVLVLDPYLKYYILGQFLTFAFNGIMFCIKTYTYLLGSDFMYNNTTPYSIFTWAVHSYLTTKIYEIISNAANYLHNRSYIQTSQMTGTHSVAHGNENANENDS
ncbi:hypothetical protein HK103_001896 [Boothiomyces macroporosus]|uniref:Uncharacterized protein n=1 Tax=Boothiomyces macroporosus TaxID=261099 RepID=A0AAD5Y0L8_9FUNG|nr:hypothetical protein HK103_001896 [Boothiomyces macroporosus]